MKLKLHSGVARQCGFSMIEILITLVIIAIALLGTAGLQTYAMKVGQGSAFRTQAVFLAADIAERMEANKSAAIDGAYVVAATSAVSGSAPDCSSGPCSVNDLAAWDIDQWGAAIVASGLPQATWQSTRTVAGDPSTYVIRIQWTDRSTQKSTAVTRGETFAYTATRTVGN